MKNRINVLIFFIILVVINLPVYAEGYESISLVKIILQLIFYIVIFALVVFLSLYGTKLIAKNFKGITSSKYIGLLDVMNIPGGGKIVLTKINKKVYILLTTNNSSNVIDIVDEGDFCYENESFDNYLSKYLNKNNINNKAAEKFIKIFNKSKDKEGRNDEK